MRRLLPLFLCALALCFARPGTAGGAAPARPTLAGPADVRPGEWIEISWSDLPADAYEAELEISLDHGAWERVSPEIDARQQQFAFRAPLAPGALARVRLRFGGDGYERESDVEIGVRIAGAPVLHEAELPLPPRHPGGIALDPVRTSVAPALSLLVHAPVSRSTLVPPAFETPALAGDAPTSPPPRTRIASRTLRYSPLRI